MERTASCFMNQFKEEIHEYRFINNKNEYFVYLQKNQTIGYKNTK